MWVLHLLPSKQLLPSHSLQCWTEGCTECNTVAGCVSMCQQVLVIMTYLHCLLWLIPKEAKQGHHCRRRGHAEWFRGPEFSRGPWNMPGILHIYRVRGVAELLVVPHRSSHSEIMASSCYLMYSMLSHPLQALRSRNTLMSCYTYPYWMHKSV